MQIRPYDALAEGYDAVMAHVDYDRWAAYLHMLIRRHADAPERVLELGGGTGSLAVRLQPLGDYDYLLTDGSKAMLDQARRKVADAGRPIRCAQADFTAFTPASIGLDPLADAAVCVYDGLNYLLDVDALAAFFERTHDALRPGGVAVVDQSTPANSEENAPDFAGEGSEAGFAWVRKSRYDPETRRHVTTFTIDAGGERFEERHVQRAYAVEEVRGVVQASPLACVAAYDAFTTRPAADRSQRVHWVLRRPPAGG
jgi:SAM-dependent methyltransferase